jgi:hypothetical protein
MLRHLAGVEPAALQARNMLLDLLLDQNPAPA